MSISAIFPAQSSYQPPSSAQSTFAQDFSQLVSSVNSGDLSGAQQAYSALSQLQSSGQGPSANPNNPVSQALSQIGQALQNGSLSGAQQALSSLQQSHSGHHSHGHHHGGGGSTSTSSSAAATTGSSTGVGHEYHKHHGVMPRCSSAPRLPSGRSRRLRGDALLGE
jgi:hypothetical protein